MLTASKTGRVTVWDNSTGAELKRLSHPDWVFSARFDSKATRVLTASRDHQARLWQLDTEKLACPAFEHEDEVFDAQFCLQGTAVATVGRDGSFVVWDLVTARPLMPPLHLPNKLHSMFVSDDSRYAVLAGQLPSIYVVHNLPLNNDHSNNLSDSAVLELTEINSGRTIHPGGGVTNLPVDEWLRRWKNFRNSHPDYDITPAQEQSELQK
jgi:WD40 repeat protein